MSEQTAAAAATTEPAGLRSVAILWRDDVREGKVEVAHGRLASVDAPGQQVVVGASPDGGQADGAFRLTAGERRLTVGVAKARLGSGALATRVMVRFGADEHGDAGTPRAFTFFLRDVRSATPILVRSLGVAVVPAGDARCYAEVEADVERKGLISEHQRIEAAPEETYEAACAAVRNQPCPVWLGVGRDVRIFRVTPQTDGPGAGGLGYWGRIEPWNHSNARDIPEDKDAVRYGFVLGRGAMCAVDIERRLEDGALPILRSVQRDGEVEYHLTLFATLEKGPLAPVGRVRGTHPVAALANTWGAMLTAEELKLYEDTLRQPEIRAREEELVCWVHISALNTGGVPRYAFVQGVSDSRPASSKYDPATGYSEHASGDVIAINLLEGVPMPQKEMAILLQPGESKTLDLLVPHRPVAPERAEALAKQSFQAHYEACRSFWQAKLDAGARISLPERAINERVRAGLLHLDLNTLGLSQSGHLLATVGWYSPIGSESSPMIQFYDSVGWHAIAERCIQFFLDRQREDGFIQTFGGYQLETGPALWTIGEHFRYTRDAAWARRVQRKVFKACDYILQWRRRNQRDELRGRGYGLIDGKVADPEDFFHSFMLNGLAYVGLKRIADMYRDIDPEASHALASELPAYLADIRAAYAQNVARSPVIPLGDGTWVPSFGPWAEYPGPVSLFAEGGDWFSHGTFFCRDTLIGALYLGIGEVLDPREPLAEWLLRAHQELMTHRNAGFSQPYYCRHDWLHMKRDEVKPFLKTYYNQLASLQDRSTYTFWEHFYGVSQHKTHEEGWFLMQTRWMLWDEDHATQTLRLLPMVPRAWMESGKQIALERCMSHFGPFTLRVQSDLAHGAIQATLCFDADAPPPRTPARVAIRLPHPRQQRPRQVIGGEYDAATESVLIASPLASPATVTLRFD